jgi:psiF repeat
MKTVTLLFAAALLIVIGNAYGQTSTCTVQAAEKKLAGAAKTSFMKRCGEDAEKACDAEAATKRLAGAAKTSFTKKCVTDAVGS